MLSEEDINLGINPKHINETEARQLALVLNLVRYPSGLSFRQLRTKMPEYYNNPVVESDQKKLQRDIDQLISLGFIIKFSKGDSFLDNVYKVEIPIEEKKIKFTHDELVAFSTSILEQKDISFSDELYTACQKIFHQDIQLFPFKNTTFKKQKTKSLDVDKVLSNLFQAIRNKTPIKITYFKNTPQDKSEREIDPLHITKRNDCDFYLVGYDRNERQKKRYVIQKILKVQLLNGDFILNHKVTSEDLNYHPLNFKVHQPTEINLETNPSLTWKLENYLYPHPFQKEKNKVSFITTNQSALFNFLWKEPSVVIDINPSTLKEEYKKFLTNLLEQYKSTI